MARCTVTICHSATRDLPGLVRQADIVVAAVGKPDFVAGDWIKPGAIVIDVGINRSADGKLVRRRRLRGGARARRVDHAGAGRRGSDDDRDAARQHAARGGVAGCGAMRARLLAALALAAAAVAMSIASAGAQPAYSAAFVSQVTPTFVEAKTTAPVSITMQNTGTATWYRDSVDVFLATQEPQDNYYWCIQDNPLRQSQRQPRAAAVRRRAERGGHVQFRREAAGVAVSPRTSPLRFRMLSQLHGTFGDETPDPRRRRVDGRGVRLAAGSRDRPGGRASSCVTVTFKNTTPTHLADDRRLHAATAGHAGNTIWSVRAGRAAGVGGAGRHRDLLRSTSSCPRPSAPTTSSGR